MTKCEVCAVELEGTREVDEGHGRVCFSCQIDALTQRLQRVERALILLERTPCPHDHDETDV